MSEEARYQFPSWTKGFLFTLPFKWMYSESGNHKKVHLVVYIYKLQSRHLNTIYDDPGSSPTVYLKKIFFKNIIFTRIRRFPKFNVL